MPADRPVVEERDAEVRRTRPLEAPGGQEVVLRPRAPDRGLRLAVDIDLLVALAEPGRAAHPDAEDRADEVALALRLEQQVVLALADGIFLAVLRVEVGRVVRQAVELDPVDVVVEQAEGLRALVLDLDPGRLAERHAPEGVVGIAAFDDDRDADDLAALAEAVGEEIADRRFDRRPGVAVPVDPEHELLVVGRALRRPALGLGPEEGDPDVGHDAGPLRVHQDVGRARRHIEVVPVALDVGVAPRVRGGIVAALARVAVPVGAAAELAHPHGRGRPHGAPRLGPGEAVEDADARRLHVIVVAAAGSDEESDQDERGQGPPSGVFHGGPRFHRARL